MSEFHVLSTVRSGVLCSGPSMASCLQESHCTQRGFLTFSGWLKCYEWTTTESYCLVFNARRYAGTVYAVVVCPSVCLSQVGVLTRQTAKHRITQITPSNHSPVSLVICWDKDLGEISMGSLPAGASNTGARYGHSYYGRLIGTRIIYHIIYNSYKCTGTHKAHKCTNSGPKTQRNISA